MAGQAPDPARPVAGGAERIAATSGAASSGEPLIELADVRKSYNIGMPNEAEVLHGLSLRITRGEFVALIGPSGSGKSTLLNIVGLLERMTSAAT